MINLLLYVVYLIVSKPPPSSEHTSYQDSGQASANSCLLSWLEQNPRRRAYVRHFLHQNKDLSTNGDARAHKSVKAVINSGFILAYARRLSLSNMKTLFASKNESSSVLSLVCILGVPSYTAAVILEIRFKSVQCIWYER